jgi:hypothetical protein
MVLKAAISKLEIEIPPATSIHGLNQPTGDF